MATPIIPPKFAAVSVAVIAIAAGIAYAVLNGMHFYDVWTTKGPTGEPGAASAYLTSALAGLIGGITALAFGLSDQTFKVKGVANVATAGSFDRSWIGALYVTIYFLVGAVAIVLWVADANPTEVVKNVATVTIGMVIPIVAGYFKT